MPSIKSMLAASAVGFCTIANAHMILGTPPPYGTPDNSPLSADGSNFPCKATSNTGGTVTDMAIGAPQTLSFIGTAVHGGGSCQVSLTKDTPATKNSVWQVIHSIEGGCPAKGAAGNLEAGQSSSNYTYSIPKGISPGAYTLAWTWFNKIGNREMYMNCASIKVSGGSSKRDASLGEMEGFGDDELHVRDTSFPAMFIANIPVTDCTTLETKDVQFPNPGSSVDMDGVSGDLAPPTGPKCGASGASSGGSSNSTTSSGTAASSGSGSAPAAPSAPAASAASGAVDSTPSVGASSGSSSSSGSSGASSGAAPSVVSPVVSSPSTSSAPSSSNYSSSSSSGSSSSSSSGATAPSTGSCVTAGASICSPDGKQIGTCTTGLTVTWIPVADGTMCQGGYMVMAGSQKRSAKFAKRYFALF